MLLVSDLEAGSGVVKEDTRRTPHSACHADAAMYLYAG
jgi:hypothetical protein